MTRFVSCIYLVFSFLAVTTAYGQTEETVIELPSRWTEGDTHALEVVKERKTYRNGKLASYQKGTTPIDIEVLEKTNTGYVLRWVFGKAESSDPSVRDNAFAQKMINLNKGMRLDIRTDMGGTPEGLENVEEVVAHYKTVAGELERWLKQSGIPAARIQQVRKGIEPVMDPKTAESLALKQPTTFLFASGGSFALNKRQEYEDLLPNPFGGEPIPSTAYFLLKEVNEEDHSVIIEWKQTLDPEKATKSLLGSMQAMVQRMGTKGPFDADALPMFTIEDSAQFLIDTRTGWPRSVAHKRSASVGKKRRVDMVTFRSRSAEIAENR